MYTVEYDETKKSFHFDFTFCTKLPSEKFSWNSTTQTEKFSLNKFIHCDYAMLCELLYYFVFFRSSQISVFHFSRIVYVFIFGRSTEMEI